MKHKILFAFFCLFYLTGVVWAQNEDFDEVTVVDDDVSVPGNNSDKFNINPDIVNFFTPKTPDWTLAVRGKVNNYHNFTLYTLSAAVTTQMDMRELKVKTGFDFGLRHLSYTFNAVYAPTFFKKFNAGVALINHVDFDYDNYVEFDFLPGFYFAYKPIERFNFNISYYYHLKNSTIFAISDSCPFVRSNAMAFDISFNGQPLDWLWISFSISSFSFYKYYLFLSPNLRLSFNFKTNDHFYIQTTAEIQFIDFFTLSANFNSLSASVSAIWRF